MTPMTRSSITLAGPVAETPRKLELAPDRREHGEPGQPAVFQSSCPACGRYHSLLQIGAALAIVAYHVGVRGTSAGWIAVEIFFVLAGYRMSHSLTRYSSALEYVGSRVRRLAPEIGVVWVICIGALLAGWQPFNLWLFLGSAPLFMQNFMEPLWSFESNENWTFLTAMWFAAALLQLQLLFVLLRRFLARGRTSLLLSFGLAGGICSRLLLASQVGPLQRDLPLGDAYILYVMPLTHLEPITLGFVLGRCPWPWRSGLSSVVMLVVLALGTLNFAYADGTMPVTSFGFPAAMRFNYQYLWGYPVLAALVAMLCAPNSPLATAVQSVQLAGPVERAIAKLASLTYGVYVFHGLFLAFLWPASADSMAGRLGAFLITAIVTFLAAWVFQTFRSRVTELWQRRAGRLPLHRRHAHRC